MLTDLQHILLDVSWRLEPEVEFDSLHVGKWVMTSDATAWHLQPTYHADGVMALL